MIPLRLSTFTGWLALAGCCIGQDGPKAKVARASRDVAQAYYRAHDGSSELRLTPDVAAHALLAVAMSTAHRMEDRMVWALRLAESADDNWLQASQVESLSDRKVMCGAAYTPVWGDQRAEQLEKLVARLLGADRDPWANVPADLQVTGVGLWGKHGGMHVGLSPMPGGFASEEAALDMWRDRCRVGDVGEALEAGGVIGVLLFGCLQPQPKAEKVLLQALQRSRAWRYDPRALNNKSVMPNPAAASFVGNRARWRAAHAAAQRLLVLNKSLRDDRSAKLERRMQRGGAAFSMSIVEWLEGMMPLVGAGADGGHVDAVLARKLDWLFQPPVMLSWYLPAGHSLGVAEDREGGFFSARIVAK